MASHRSPKPERLRAFVRAAYRAVPLKPALFALVRKLWSPPERLYKHLHFSGVINVAIDKSHAFKMRALGGTDENRLFWSGYSGDYEPVSLELWRRLAVRSKIIVDAGAHHGLYSLAARALNAEAAIFAFEPLERVFDTLAGNIVLNGYDIGAEAKALSDTTGQIEFFDLPEDQPVSASADNEVARLRPDAIVRTLPSVRLDDFLAEAGAADPDLIKIDVERHEPAVLRGMGAVLARARPAILLEVLNDSVAEQLELLLKDLGLSYFLLREESRTVVPVSSLRPEAAVGQNFLIAPPELARAIGLDPQRATAIDAAA
jgi:FkbM family methyltransferase